LTIALFTSACAGPTVNGRAMTLELIAIDDDFADGKTELQLAYAGGGYHYWFTLQSTEPDAERWTLEPPDLGSIFIPDNGGFLASYPCEPLSGQATAHRDADVIAGEFDLDCSVYISATAEMDYRFRGKFTEAAPR
jgi:hypothetical protein